MLTAYSTSLQNCRYNDTSAYEGYDTIIGLTFKMSNCSESSALLILHLLVVYYKIIVYNFLLECFLLLISQDSVSSTEEISCTIVLDNE